MEVLGESVPVFYYDELSIPQRGALQIFARELALRVEVVQLREPGEQSVSEVDSRVLSFGDEMRPWIDLAQERLDLIAEFGVDPLRVLPGNRPA